MLVLANVLLGFGEVLFGVLWLYQWILVARMIISWVNADPRNPIVSFIRAVTEPPMRLIRHRLPTSLRYFPLDIAFLVLFAIVILARYGVAQSLLDYAAILHTRAL